MGIRDSYESRLNRKAGRSGRSWGWWIVVAGIVWAVIALARSIFVFF